MSQVPLRKIRQTSVTEQAFLQLRDLIQQKHWEPGQRLPTERELSTLLGISRPSVREALRQLEAYGLTVSRPGAGSYVASPESERSRLMLTGDERPADLFELREILESSAAALAAVRRTPDDLAALRARIEDDSAAGESRVGRFLEFHRLVARASHNPALAAAVDDIERRIDERLWAPMRSRDIASNIGADETMLAHAALLKAIEQGQSEQARRIMADHLSSQLATLLS